MREPGSSSRTPCRVAIRRAASAALGLAVAGCAHAPSPPPPEPTPARSTAPAPEVLRRAEAMRIKLLEAEISRLNADVKAAEDTLVVIESDLRGPQGRTQAVSMLAEARIQVDRAAKLAPWRAEMAKEARAKLDEANRQLDADRVASAIFFVSRASRLSQTILEEADLVAKAPEARFVKLTRVNLRSAPDTSSDVLAVLEVDLPIFVEANEADWLLVRTVSGQVGWLRGDLVRAR